MKRGEVWWVKFNTPSVGDEIEKQRPAVIKHFDGIIQPIKRQIIPFRNFPDCRTNIFKQMGKSNLTL